MQQLSVCLISVRKSPTAEMMFPVPAQPLPGQAQLMPLRVVLQHTKVLSELAADLVSVSSHIKPHSPF